MKTTLETPKQSPRGFEPMNFNELDKPTFIRRHRDESHTTTIPFRPKPAKTNIYNQTKDEDLPPEPDELDTPTFLRKQMD